jgi:hypothetical protein
MFRLPDENLFERWKGDVVLVCVAGEAVGVMVLDSLKINTGSYPLIANPFGANISDLRKRCKRRDN